MKIMTQQEMAAWDAGTFELITSQARTAASVAHLIDSAHRVVGDKRAGFGSKAWRMTDEQVLAELEDRREEHGRPGSFAPLVYLGNINDGRRLVERLGSQIEEREAVWAASGRWARYFPCLSRDGHIHATLRGCPTVRQDTGMGWATEMSGLSADQAVHGVEGQFEGLGETLCSVCFPGAPVQWCRTRSEVARAEREAAKAARQEAKYAKRLRPDEVFRQDAGKGLRVETVAACKTLARQPAETLARLEWRRSTEGRSQWADPESGLDEECYARLIAGIEERLAVEQADAEKADDVLFAREAAVPGTGWTREESDRAYAAALKRARRDYFG